ncbi:MAG: hypothetical protein EOO36_07550 [Cytophagaceae bacterium]|nr:MAG: hypothetical protein EOO36_07550 [Cytophagaceae bacterium]
MAQATKPATLATGQPGTLTGPMPTNPVPASATTPTDADGAIYANPNGVPTRNVNGGTQRADQPRVGTMGMPAVSGSQQPYRIHKGRPSARKQQRDSQLAGE